MIRRPAALITAAVVATVLGGCGGTPHADDRGTPSATGQASAAVGGALTVLAAASLTESFTTIGRRFEAAHPGSTVTFSFGSSAALATQIDQGAPADVFAAADRPTMRTVADAGNAAGTPTIFATNTLQIAVPPGNPGRITGLADFADPAKRTALCAPQVPCGAAARKLFAVAGVQPAPSSYEADVKAALQKVESDEVDAALVYRTDVTAAAGKVSGIAVPQAGQVINSYPITVLKGTRNAAAARAFVAYVSAGPGRQVLRRAGFGAP